MLPTATNWHVRTGIYWRPSYQDIQGLIPSFYEVAASNCKHYAAPAGGINAATWAVVVRYCVNQGHIPLGIYNGFCGLLDDNVNELSWLGVDAWMARGGSELGTNREPPDGAIASKFQQFHFGALLIIGGSGGFISLQILEEGETLSSI